jgi:hypothetical protein
MKLDTRLHCSPPCAHFFMVLILAFNDHVAIVWAARENEQ